MANSWRDLLMRDSADIHFDGNGVGEWSPKWVPYVAICWMQDGTPLSSEVWQLAADKAMSSVELHALIRHTIDMMLRHHSSTTSKVVSPNAWAITLLAVVRFFPADTKLYQTVADIVRHWAGVEHTNNHAGAYLLRFHPEA